MPRLTLSWISSVARVSPYINDWVFLHKPWHCPYQLSRNGWKTFTWGHICRQRAQLPSLPGHPRSCPFRECLSSAASQTWHEWTVFPLARIISKESMGDALFVLMRPRGGLKVEQGAVLYLIPVTSRASPLLHLPKTSYLWLAETLSSLPISLQKLKSKGNTLLTGF